MLSGGKSGYPIGAVSSFKARSATYNSIRLFWDKVSDAKGYKIYRASSQKGGYRLVKTISKGSITSWKDTRLKAGTRYYYKIKAYKSGAVGGTSKYRSARAVPATVSVAVSKVKRKGNKVRWGRVSSVTGYKIYRASSKHGKYKRVATQQASKSFYVDKVKNNKKTYYYKVRAYKHMSGKNIYGAASEGKKIVK